MSNESEPPAVEARAILAALVVVRRRGQWPLLQELEKLEPELASYLMEELSAVHQTLLATRAPPKVVRRLQRQIQSLVLVCHLAVRPIQPG